MGQGPCPNSSVWLWRARDPIPPWLPTFSLQLTFQMELSGTHTEGFLLSALCTCCSLLVRLTPTLDRPCFPASLKTPTSSHITFASSLVWRSRGTQQVGQNIQGPTPPMNAHKPPAHTGTPRGPGHSFPRKGWASGQVHGDAKYSQTETEFQGSSRPGLGLAAPCLAFPRPRTGWAQLASSLQETGLTCFSQQ